jgi:metal-responsive CopG/Arc/MetJ family transcriptional regulator
MPKVRVTVSLSKDVVDWLDSQVAERVYKDRSHALEKIIFDLMKEKKASM